MKSFILVSILLLTFSCNQESKDPVFVDNVIKSNWRVVNRDQYSLHYPDSFQLNTEVAMGMDLVLLSRKNGINDSFVENVNVAIQSLKDLNIDLDRYVDISENQVNRMVTNKIIFESKREFINGKEFHRLRYSGDQGVFRLIWDQFYCVNNETAYVLTLTCNEDEYSDFEDVGSQIIRSINIK